MFEISSIGVWSPNPPNPREKTNPLLLRNILLPSCLKFRAYGFGLQTLQTQEKKPTPFYYGISYYPMFEISSIGVWSPNPPNPREKTNPLLLRNILLPYV